MAIDYVRLSVSELAQLLNLDLEQARRLTAGLPRVRGLNRRTKLYVPLAFIEKNQTRQRRSALAAKVLDHDTKGEGEIIRREKRKELYQAERAAARQAADAALRAKLKGERREAQKLSDQQRILNELANGLTQVDMFD